MPQDAASMNFEPIAEPSLSRAGWMPFPNQPLVTVNGIPTLRGRLIKRSGAVSILRRSDGKLFEVHQEWCQEDKAERSEAAPRAKAKRILREYAD
jgi:hypothetical protein